MASSEVISVDSLRAILADALEGAADRLRSGRQAATDESAWAVPVVPEEVSARLAISVTEAAERLGVSRNTVYTAIRSDEMPTFRMGRRTLIPVDALRRWIASASVGR
jgi:excisionase family DNA binding protein